MTTQSEAFLTDWHRMVSERDFDSLRKLLADDVSLGAPPYWARLDGVELVQHLLEIILTTIDDFTYHREWQTGSELALEFKGRVGDIQLQGIDLITLNDQSQVQSLDVLIRPANAVDRLRDIIAPQMQSFLASRSQGTA